MRNLTMFIAAVCFIFLLKLRWPKNKSLQYQRSYLLKYTFSFNYRGRRPAAILKTEKTLGMRLEDETAKQSFISSDRPF